MTTRIVLRELFRGAMRIMFRRVLILVRGQKYIRRDVDPTAAHNRRHLDRVNEDNWAGYGDGPLAVWDLRHADRARVPDLGTVVLNHEGRAGYELTPEQTAGGKVSHIATYEQGVRSKTHMMKVLTNLQVADWILSWVE
jgi:hypothetical protein